MEKQRIKFPHRFVRLPRLSEDKLTFRDYICEMAEIEDIRLDSEVIGDQIEEYLTMER